MSKIEEFEEMLNDSYPEYSMGWVSFTPASILLNCDPIAYRIAYQEYCDFIEEEEEDVYLAS